MKHILTIEKFIQNNTLTKSNLTLELQEIVRSTEFKNWFGDWEFDKENASVILDENNEPLIVYHRTSAMFDTFDKNKLGKTSGWKTAKFGFYFSNKLEEYSYGRDYKACFLNIRNPYYIETEYFSDFDQDFKKFDTNNFSQNDGIIIKCNKIIPEYEKSDKHFVIFEPNQVKSIHNTSFSVDNNNIYM